MSKLEERIQKREEKKNRKYRFLKRKIVIIIFMAVLSTAGVFFADYNMNKMIMRESLLYNLELRLVEIRDKFVNLDVKNSKFLFK